METQNKPTLPPYGRPLLAVWGIILAAIFLGMGFYTTSSVNHLRTEAAARHEARMDPLATEAGKTAAENKLPPGANPKKVSAGIYIDGVASISVLEAYWEPVFYIWFRWEGDLAPGETFNIIEGEILSREKLAEQLSESGENYALYLVRAKITKFFSASRFPMDDHLMTIAIEDGGKTWAELEYVPDTENSGISSRVKMPGYKASRTALVMKPHTYRSNFGDPNLKKNERKTYSQLLYGIWNTRPGFGPYSKVFLGLFAAVAIALLAFFIKPTDVDPRFGLGVGGFFGAVANALLSASLVPESGSMTLMDMVNGVGMATIFITLVQSTISLHLYDIREEHALSKAFDRLSLILIATGFTTINILIPWLASKS